MSGGFATQEYLMSKNQQMNAMSRKRPFNAGPMAGNTANSTMPEDQEGTPLLKLLVPPFVGGLILGKNGERLNELQKKYSVRIRVGMNNQYYPGTEERVVIFTAAIYNIKKIHNYIINMLDADALDNPIHIGSIKNVAKQKVRIVCRHGTCGFVMGPKGARLNQIIKDTGAGINISRFEDSAVFNERIITITGTLQQRINATNQLTDIIAANPENLRRGKRLNYANFDPEEDRIKAEQFRAKIREMHGYPAPMPGSHGPRPFGNGVPSNRFGGPHMMNQGPRGGFVPDGGHGPGFGNRVPNNRFGGPQMMNQGSREGFVPDGGFNGSAVKKPKLNDNAVFSSGGFSSNAPKTMGNTTASQMETNVQMQIKVPEVLCGVLLNNGAKLLHEVIQFSQAKINLTPRNEFQQPRVLTIIGDENQTQTASFMINQKLQRAKDALNMS